MMITSINRLDDYSMIDQFVLVEITFNNGMSDTQLVEKNIVKQFENGYLSLDELYLYV